MSTGTPTSDSSSRREPVDDAAPAGVGDDPPTATDRRRDDDPPAHDRVDRRPEPSDHRHREGSDDQYREVPDHRHREGSDDQYREVPDDQYREGSDDQYREGSDDGYRESPDDLYREGPDDQYREGPDDQYRESPDDVYREGPDDQYREGSDDQYPELSDDRSKGRPSAARSITSIVAGLTVAMSMPPWGFWPLSFVGVAMFELALGTTPTRRQRATYGALFGAAWTYLGMAWMVQLTVPGYLVSGVVYGTFHACAALAVPPGRWEIIGRPAAHTLVEALRFSFPFGGVPLASMGIAQVSGPLAGIARVGGVILITWAVFQVGFVLGALTRDLWHRVRAPQRQPSPPGERAEAAEPHGRSMPPMPSMPSVPSMPSWHTSWRFVVIPLVAVVGLLGVAVVAPRGEATGESMRIAAIQGGGEQGTSAIEVPSILVTERHLETTASIEPDPDLDLVLWPENTVDVLDFESSAIRDLIAAEASRLGVPISVGITEETDDPDRFVNAQVVVGPDGTIVARYDKVRRVPFGEYVPLRGVLEALGAPVDRIGRDALAGTEPAVVRLPDGTPLGVVISWEVFFGGRAREGVREGGLAIVNPTNGASYTGTIVQTQQVASSRLRSIENGRWTVQAAPTGFTAVIDADGAVLERSAISERTVIVTDVELRDGFTWYTNLGDAPIIVVILAVYALAVSLTLRDRRRGELAPAARDGSTD